MTTINGVASSVSGTRNTYTISNGVPGDWTIIGGGDNLNFIGASTNVTSVDLHFKTPTNGRTLRYTSGATVVDRNLVVTGIPIISANSVYSGMTIPVSVNSSIYLSGTWSIQFGISTFVDTNNNNAPIVTASGPSATFQGQSSGTVIIRFSTTSTPFGDEGIGTKTITVNLMPIQIDGFPVVLNNPSVNLASGDTYRMYIDPSYDPFYANNVNGPNSQGVWSFEAAIPSNFESATSGVDEVNVKAMTFNISSGFWLRYTGSNGCLGRRYFNVNIIPISGATSTLSGNNYTYTVDSTKYATGGTWDCSNTSMQVLSQTSTSATFKARGIAGQGSGSGFVRYVAGNGGNGRLFVTINPIPLTGPTLVNTGFPYNYEAVGYTGGTWYTTTPSIALTNTTTNIVTATFFEVVSNKFINYWAANEGDGRIVVTSVFAIFGPNQIEIGSTPDNQITIYIPIEQVGKNGYWSTTTPSIISIVEGDQMNAATNKTAIVTGLSYGTGVARYFNNNGSTEYTYNITVMAPLPIANDDSLSFNTVVGGSLNLVINDTLDGRPLQSTEITDYSTVSPSLVSIDSSGLFTALPGIPGGSYVLKYTITTDYGTSLPADINLTVTATPPVANDNTLANNNNSGGSFNLVTNDDLNGRTLQSATITDYSTLNSSYVSLTNAGIFTVVTGTPVGTYTLKYTITTDNGTSNEANINLTVTNTNIPPVAIDDSLTVNFVDGGTLNLVTNDNLNGRPLLTATITDYGGFDPSYVTLDNTGLFTVLPNAPGPSTYTLKYEITTDNGTSNEADIQLEIQQTVPVLGYDQFTIDNSTIHTLDVIANDNLFGRALISGSIDIFSELDSSQVSIDSNGMLVVNAGIAPNIYNVIYTLTTDNGTSDPQTIELTIINPNSPVAVDYLNEANIDSTQGLIVYVTDDADLKGGTVSSINIVSFARDTPSISPEFVNFVGKITPEIFNGSIIIDPNLEPGSYTIEYTITTENGTSNVAIITFNVTSMPSDSNGNFTENSLDITNFFGIPELIFVRDVPKSIADLNSSVFDDYLASQNLSPAEEQDKRTLLETFAARPLEVLRRSGKDVFDGQSLIKKRQIELLEQPKSFQTSTLKVSYDTDDLPN